MIHIPEGNYLTLLEVAERAGVARITVQKWAEYGLLPTINIPRLGKLVNENDLIEFLKRDRPHGYPNGRPRKQN